LTHNNEVCTALKATGQIVGPFHSQPLFSLRIVNQLYSKLKGYSLRHDFLFLKFLFLTLNPSEFKGRRLRVPQADGGTLPQGRAALRAPLNNGRSETSSISKSNRAQFPYICSQSADRFVGPKAIGRMWDLYRSPCLSHIATSPLPTDGTNRMGWERHCGPKWKA
jgi:hypothetical protein